MDEIAAAFGHPEARAALLPPGTPAADRISLRDHVREAEIGAFESERDLRQRLRFDVVVEVGPVAAGDDVDRILSYDRLAEAIDAELAAARVSLLETLAEGVAGRILREPLASRVILRIQKLDRGPGALGVEIVRERAGDAPPPDALRPRVILVEAGADGPGLDELLGEGGPLLLVAPPAPAPRADTPEAQRRVDLLAADQGAWLLAALAPRLTVASTRTEIDWALRRGRPVVWAPAKLSLDEGWAGLGHEERAMRLEGLWRAG